MAETTEDGTKDEAKPAEKLDEQDALINDIRQLKDPAAKELEARYTRQRQKDAQLVKDLQAQIHGLHEQVKALTQVHQERARHDDYAAEDYDAEEAYDEPPEDMYEALESPERFDRALASTGTIRTLSRDNQSLRNKLINLEAKLEVFMVRSKYSDFDQQKERVREIIRRNPTLGIEDAYLLATRKDEFEKGRKAAIDELEREKKARLERPKGILTRPAEELVLGPAQSMADTLAAVEKELGYTL